MWKFKKLHKWNQEYIFIFTKGKYLIYENNTSIDEKNTLKVIE